MGNEIGYGVCLIGYGHIFCLRNQPASLAMR